MGSLDNWQLVNVMGQRPGVNTPGHFALYEGFSLRTPEAKSSLIQRVRNEKHLQFLGAGTQSIRTRPNLSVTNEGIDLLLEMLGELPA